MAHFVFASDSFKGTFSSLDTARMLEEAARRHFPDCRCSSIPMADGGEGSVDALVSACGGRKRHVVVQDPLGRPVTAAYGLLGGGRAIVEAAASSGLILLANQERNPLETGSWGLGQLILDAMDQGCRDVTLALGGSATNDGGMGCMSVLGVRFLDEGKATLRGAGADLRHVASVDLSGLDARVRETLFTVLCDVDNPLLGAHGATATFGPQKGASPQMVEELEEGMRNYANVLQTCLGRNFDVPGAGAAGGLGAACEAFLDGHNMSGISQILRLSGFMELLPHADLVITGEGHLDAQTARGKVLSGVGAACLHAHVPCVAIVGGMEPEAHIPGICALVPTETDAMSLPQVLEQAEELYGLAADRVFSLIRLGLDLKG